MARFNPGTAATTAAIAATARKLNRPGAGGDLQSATGGGYRAPGQRPGPNAAELRARQRIGTPVPTQAAPSPTAPAAPAGLPKRYAGMDPGVAAERFKMFKAGQLPGQQGASAPLQRTTIGGGPMRAEDAAAFRAANPNPFGDAPGRMQDLVRSLPMEFQTGGGLQAPGGAPSPASQPPGIEGAIANLRNQLGESPAGGAGPSGADPMSMIAQLRGNAQIAQANGYPIGGAGGGMIGAAQATGGQYGSVPGQPGKGSAPMPGQGGVMKPFFGDISQMTGAPSGPAGLSGLPVAGGAGPGGNPYLSLLRNRLGA